VLNEVEVIKYCYSVLYLLSCEVHKWLKFSYKKKSLPGIAYYQQSKVTLMVSIMWTTKAK